MGSWPHQIIFNYGAFSHDVTAALLVFQDNKTAAMLVMLVFHTNPVGVGLFSDVNAYRYFVPINLHRC